MSKLLRQIESLRTRIQRGSYERPFTSPDEALTYVNAMKLTVLFPAKQLALPDLWYFAEDSEAWKWKDELPARKAAFYSRVIANRASIVSLDLLPSLYSISLTADYGGDRFEIYRAGHLRAETNRLIGILNAKGPLTTKSLKRETGMSGYKFKKALEEAQVMFLAVRAETTPPGFGTYTYIWDGFYKVWPEIIDAGLKIRYEQALLDVIAAYLRIAVAVPTYTITTIFNMDEDHCLQMIDWMLAEGMLTQLEIGDMDYIILTEMLEALDDHLA